MRLTRFGFFISFLFFLSLAQAQNLQGYPDYQELFLNDYARVVTDADASILRAETAFLKDETGIELTVLTIDSIRDYPTGDTSIESFATNLFNTWGIGDSSANDGALILVAVKDRDMRIELGDGYGRRYDAMAQNIIDRFMLPMFRQNNYSTGILYGSQELNRQLRAIQSGVPVSSPISSPISSPSSGYPINQPINNQPSLYNYPSYNSPRSLPRSLPNSDAWFGGVIAALFGGGGGLYALIRRRMRYAARACQSCEHQLHLLDEVSDDVYLDDGQLAEEYLKSIDYDVWLCDNCNQHELHSYPEFFSGYKNCPKCRYRTMKTKRRTLESPDCNSGGRDEITTDCWRDNCDYFNRHTVHTPARNCDDDTSGFSSSSSSSGGGSFGGGSSSGGGASGSW